MLCAPATAEFFLICCDRAQWYAPPPPSSLDPLGKPAAAAHQVTTADVAYHRCCNKCPTAVAMTALQAEIKVKGRANNPVDKV